MWTTLVMVPGDINQSGDQMVMVIKAPPPHVVHEWSSWKTEPGSRTSEPRYRTCGCGAREYEDEQLPASQAAEPANVDSDEAEQAMQWRRETDQTSEVEHA